MCCHSRYHPKLALRRTRISAMTVSRLNATIQPVNDKFGALIAADFSSSIYCLLLSGVVAAGTLGSTTFHIPTPVGIVNNMMRRTSHIITPYVLRDSRLHNRPHRNRFSLPEPLLQLRCQSSPHTVCCGYQVVQHAPLYGLRDEDQGLKSDCC